MKHWTVTALDNRHAGRSLFSHYVTPVWTTRLNDKLMFLQWRNWCWASFGPGMERDLAIELGDSNIKWAWHTEGRIRRLYFRSTKEYNWFTLKWSTDD